MPALTGPLVSVAIIVVVPVLLTSTDTERESRCSCVVPGLPLKRNADSYQ